MVAGSLGTDKTIRFALLGLALAACGARAELTAVNDDGVVGTGGAPGAGGAKPSLGGATSTGAGGTTSTGVGGANAVAGSVGVGATGSQLPTLPSWYVYADGLGPNGRSPGTCQLGGMHPDSQCSQVQKPLPESGPFPNDGSPMCVFGTVALIGLLNGLPDYSNVWGAGLGLDFMLNGMPAELDAPAHGVVGIEFDIDQRPVPGLRVEFKTSTRDPNGPGYDYWGADATYPLSPVRAGSQQVYFDKVASPAGFPFDRKHIQGVLFHVPTSIAGSSTFYFCISKLRLITR